MPPAPHSDRTAPLRLSVAEADLDAPGIAVVLVNPLVGIHRPAFVRWYQAFHRTLERTAGLERVRFLELADEQLLPHRAAGASHRFQGIYEFATVTDMIAGLPRLLPASLPTAGDVVDVSRIQIAPFQEICSIREANPLPAGVRPRPNGDVPPGGPGVFMAFTRPVDEASEQAYNEWYNHHHLPETLNLLHVHRGRRHRRLPLPPAVTAAAQIETPYLTLYDLSNVAAVPANRSLMPWLASVAVDHLGPDCYDKDFTQAFVYADVTGWDQGRSASRVAPLPVSTAWQELYLGPDPRSQDA